MFLPFHGDGLTPVSVENELVLLPFHGDGLTPVSATIMNLKRSHYRRILRTLCICNGNKSSKKRHYIDRHNISGSAQHLYATALPPRIAELNSKWSIFSTPEGTVGVQQPFEGCVLNDYT